MAELADAQDLGSCGATCGGSNPPARTKDFIWLPGIVNKYQGALFFSLWKDANAALPATFCVRGYLGTSGKYCLKNGCYIQAAVEDQGGGLQLAG